MSIMLALFGAPLILEAALILFALMASIVLACWLAGVRYIPHDRVGIIEKLWSPGGSLREGRILAMEGEAGFQSRILRGGVHFGLFPWQYRIHRAPLVTVREGKIGYVYSSDGAPLTPMQTLGCWVDCNSFQDADAFLKNGGQRGRQRAILREGVYAINTALFTVITEQYLFSLVRTEMAKYSEWQQQLIETDGFSPVVIGYGGKLEACAAARMDPGAAPPIKQLSEVEKAQQLLPTDTIGVVSVHDGPPIEHGDIIAPEIPASADGDHNYFQDPEAFLRLGGRRGRQLQVLTDGTFFINRWFATVEIKPKTLIPIGYVGVVVSYHGAAGEDVTGTAFRYGEQVDPGRRGVWKRAFPPGKYALSPYALKVELVPTVNFVLRWITGQTESHKYDADLSSIELITADGYEPLLPLSLVLHIDYEKASSVVQRFGDVKRLITQTLDPILTAYFRDVAQSCNMLDLLTRREEIQKHATEELGRRFSDYDINCVAVLIGRPESNPKFMHGGEDSIERLFDQLRQRRLAEEQKETFAKQQEAAHQLKELNHAQAAAAKQSEVTQTKIEVEISANRGEAQLAEAHRLARRDVVRAEAEAQTKELLGKGEGARINEIGSAEAAVFHRKIAAYGDSRLFAMNLIAEQLSKSVQPLVPERMIALAGNGENGNANQQSCSGLLSILMSLLVSEKSGVQVMPAETSDTASSPVDRAA